MYVKKYVHTDVSVFLKTIISYLGTPAYQLGNIRLVKATLTLVSKSWMGCIPFPRIDWVLTATKNDLSQSNLLYKSQV